MSRVRRMIELKPDMNGETCETLVSVGHRCEYCQGNGCAGERMIWGKVLRLPAQSVKARVSLMQSSTLPGSQPVKIRAYGTAGD